MDSRYAYLGIITAGFAFIGLLARYFLPIHGPYQSLMVAGLFIVGSVLFGYGYGDGWKWPAWLGSILVMLAFILLGNVPVLWFVFAAGLGAITYAYQRPIHHAAH